MPETFRMNIRSNPIPLSRRVSPAASIIGPKGGAIIMMIPEVVTIRPPRHIRALTMIANPRNTDRSAERPGGLEPSGSVEGLSGSSVNHRSVSFSSMRRLRA